MKKHNILDWICFILVLIGALNWGIYGISDHNIVQMIFGQVPWLLKVIYIVVGLAGLWSIYTFSKGCKGHSHGA